MSVHFTVKALLINIIVTGASMLFLPSRYHRNHVQNRFVKEESSKLVQQRTATTTTIRLQLDQSSGEDPSIVSKFKVLTCAATSCASQRKARQMDQFATFSAFWIRIQESESVIEIEESSCLGACKRGPCVAVEHDDYEGTVALVGMTADEFQDRCFHNVCTEEDVDHVWSCIQNAIRVISQDEQSRMV